MNDKIYENSRDSLESLFEKYDNNKNEFKGIDLKINDDQDSYASDSSIQKSRGTPEQTDNSCISIQEITTYRKEKKLTFQPELIQLKQSNLYEVNHKIKDQQKTKSKSLEEINRQLKLQKENPPKLNLGKTLDKKKQQLLQPQQKQIMNPKLLQINSYTISSSKPKIDRIRQLSLNPSKSVVKSETHKEAKKSQHIEKVKQLCPILKKTNSQITEDKKSFQGMFQEKCGIFTETGKPIFEFNSLIKYLFLKDYSKDSENETYNKIPKKFKSDVEYCKIFEYLFLNEAFQQIKQELQRINKSKFRRIQIKQDDVEIDKDGLIFQMRQYQQNPKEKNKDRNNEAEKKQQDDSDGSVHKEEGVCDLTALKNYIVIISNKYSFNPAKINKMKEKRQLFFGMLIEPQTHQYVNQIKIQTFVPRDPLYLNWVSVYLFPFVKITTQIREYLMINKITQTPLYPLILDPKSQQHLIGADKDKIWNINSSNIIPNGKVMDPFFNYINQNYNFSQATAIQQIILQDRGISLLQGPPGTGKTHTLIGLLSGVYEYMKIMNKFPKKKILICAPSNAAIDEIIFRILQGGLFDCEGRSRTVKLVRLGVLDEENDKSVIIKQVSLEDVAQYQLFNKSSFKANSDQKTTGELRIELSKTTQAIKKIKEMEKYDEQQKKQLNELWNKRNQLMQYLEQVRTNKRNQKENYVLFCEKIISEAEILCSTLSTAGTDKLSKFIDSFELLIVDEAAQCTEPSNNIPLRLGMRKMILIGDPKQLPATTFSSVSQITHYNRSLFERILDNDFKPFFLDMQYRMHPQIREFPSLNFYDNKLIDHFSVYERLIPNNFFNQRVLFIDVESEETKDEKSFQNQTECNMIVEVLKNIKNAYPSQSLGVICAYKAQVRLIKLEIKRQLGDLMDEIQINTVDSFQGQERDVILFSCVRSSSSGNIGFLQDGRRVNVALTRAKNALFIFGNAITLGQCQLWKNLLLNLHSRKLYRYVGKNDYFSFKVLAEDIWFDRQRKMNEQLLNLLKDKELILQEELKTIEQNKDTEYFKDKKEQQVTKTERNLIPSPAFIQLPNHTHNNYNNSGKYKQHQKQPSQQQKHHSNKEKNQTKNKNKFQKLIEKNEKIHHHSYKKNG
ncbi:unnamed protein product (macronuclear) [Paramecium tetraurelia]|uniref:Chromosome undetermined scaffold_1, whole genome shotgun sequence n=1 Tax=Paramecium tetraurelia TaxID=5888 RepID=Q6BGI0_PARTE|nr:TRNA-splicing endonuclease positive effector [Paramecium tetraurelia strain d4-2]XP_001423474.1 uncharacterized protein GSPATT00000512001 [Paramecium tetraurelia]CAH03240.1 TRNA-splicing endonuclease positive effector, putative [Paramecium tetraurelia]CAK56076.1 unnamed protein product [Paramecium tetraurelia]|eukprot:XP_001423474.1 hypothetical protein (macronuclear) [Paramecium tetraurelia strain d4-2]